MDNLTPESAAVRLYAAYHREYGGKAVEVALSRLRSDRNLLLDWQHVAIAADRLCAERLATAEREARVRGLEIAAAVCDRVESESDDIGEWQQANGCSDCGVEIRALIIAAEAQPQENAHG